MQPQCEAGSPQPHLGLSLGVHMLDCALQLGQVFISGSLPGVYVPSGLDAMTLPPEHTMSASPATASIYMVPRNSPAAGGHRGGGSGSSGPTASSDYGVVSEHGRRLYAIRGMQASTLAPKTLNPSPLTSNP